MAVTQNANTVVCDRAVLSVSSAPGSLGVAWIDFSGSAPQMVACAMSGEGLAVATVHGAATTVAATMNGSPVTVPNLKGHATAGAFGMTAQGLIRPVFSGAPSMLMVVADGRGYAPALVDAAVAMLQVVQSASGCVISTAVMEQAVIRAAMGAALEDGTAIDTSIDPSLAEGILYG